MDKTKTENNVPPKPRRMMTFKEFIKSDYVAKKPKEPKKK